MLKHVNLHSKILAFWALLEAVYFAVTQLLN